jgi:hypothetical protein
MQRLWGLRGFLTANTRGRIAPKNTTRLGAARASPSGRPREFIRNGKRKKTARRPLF